MFLIKQISLGILFVLANVSVFAWSVSGVVESKGGVPLSGVKITSFNYPSVAGETGSDGTFSISGDASSINGLNENRVQVQYSNGILNINNVKAQILKISMIDALGKVIYNRSLQQVYGQISLDFSNLKANKAKFLRVNFDGNAETYMIGTKGVLLKEEIALPAFIFQKEGYKNLTYQMQIENESNVLIQMEEGSNEIIFSSSANFPISSSSITPSSSSKLEVPVDCSSKTLKSNTTMTIDGRKVIVKFPSGYTGSKPVPLLVNYHPIMGSASQWESGSQIAQTALSDGAIVAFMDGAQGPMGQAWNVGPCCTDADDVTFSRNFITEITKQACVDTKRIYAAGFSMGGGFSNYAGCFMADIFAAAAPSAFDLAKEIVDAGLCKPSRPFPILNFRGTNDNVVMYDGGLSQVVSGKPITFMGAKNNLKEWGKMNGCSGNPVDKGNGCEYYENCKDGVKVGLCTIQGGGHSEGDANTGWNFLKQFSMP